MNELEKETEPASDLASTSSIPPLLPDEERGSQDGSLYKYRDFSSINEDEEDVGEVPAPSPGSRGNVESSIRVQKFPVKLYAILAQKEFHDIITWMPHGRAWKVLKPSMFESMVMPLFFEYSNYHSFNRLVNAWSFRRVSSGPDRGSYYHELFLRGKPQLQKYMRRLPKTHKKLPMKKEDEPDFYALDKSNPLPALEDAPVPGAAATSVAMQSQAQRGLFMMHGQGQMMPHNIDMVGQRMKQQIPGNNGFHSQHQQQTPGLQNQMFGPENVISQVEEFDLGQPMNFREQQQFHQMRGMDQQNGGYGQSNASQYRQNIHHQMEPLNPDLFTEQPSQLQQTPHTLSPSSQSYGGASTQSPDELYHLQQQMKLQRMSQLQGGGPQMHPSVYQDRGGGSHKANHLMPEDFRPRAQLPQC